MGVLDGSDGAGNPGTGQAAAGNSGGGAAAGAAGAGGKEGASGAQPSWRDSLPEDIKGNVALQTFSDVGSLAKSYLHAQSLVGKKGIIPPGAKATDEEMSSFYRSLGQPELEKFEIKVAEDAGLDSDTISGFKEVAHKAGLLPQQAQGVLDWYLKRETETLAALEKSVETESNQAIADLKKEWAAGYDKNVSFAQMAVKELGGEEFQTYLRESGLGNDVNVIKFMAKVGELLGEDKLRGHGGGKFGKTPTEIQREIDQIRGDPKHPYFDKTHPGHKHATQEMDERYKQLVG